MGNCCSTEASAVVARLSGDKDEVHAVPYAALPSSPHKYAATEDTEPRVTKDEEPASSSSPSPSPSSSPSLSPETQADTFVPPHRPSNKHLENTHHVKIGDYNLRYSYYSKRGYYPEGRYCDSTKR